MFILITLLIAGVKFEPTSLVNLKGKWTVSLRMRSLLIPDQYSILWRPWKTFMIGIEGMVAYKDDVRWKGSADIELYKYFRASNSVSPYVSLLPGIRGYKRKGGSWEYDLTLRINSGIEYFFVLFKRSTSVKLKANILHAYYYSADREWEEEFVRVWFYFPTAMSLSTWLCFHF